MAADTQGEWLPVPPGFQFPVPTTTLYDPYDRTRTISDTRGLFVVHAALLRTGKILCFCGYVESLYYAPIAYLYDPTVPATTTLKAVPMPAGTDLFCCHFVQLYDGRILVIGGSQQDDLSAAALQYHGSEGARTVVVFDPTSETFTTPPGVSLAQGRWYPTVVMLADGRAAVLSGRRESGAASVANPAGIADAVEVISAKADRRTTLSNTGAAAPRLPIYPGAHLAPDGKVYTTHTTWGQEVAEPPSQRLTLTATTSSWTPLPGPAPQPVQALREEGMSVPLPVTKPRANTRGRYLIVGGGQAIGHNPATTANGPILQVGGPANAEFTGHLGTVNLKSAEILDTTASAPTWTQVAPGASGPAAGPGLTSERVNCHCVLLPDATIAVMGGHNAYKWQASANDTGVTEQTTTPSLTVELFKPGAGFTVGAAMTFPRMYHSVALLMPDGRVWIAGGADPNENEPWISYPAGWKGRRYDGRTTPGTPGPFPAGPRKNGQPGSGAVMNRKDYQIYRPPYLCKGLPQPTITSITPGSQVLYGATFTITSPQAASIAHVAIMRPGAATHHTDSEQRYIELDAAPAVGNNITVTMVDATEANVVTPGYYMVWIIDNQGIPCANAKFIQVTYPPPWPDPPNDAIESWPCIIATVSLGSASAPDVIYLRSLRDELAASGTLGRRFIDAVNALYYSFSPRTARYLQRHSRWRAAVRDVVVVPGTRCIRGARRLVDRLPWRGAHTPALITALTIEGAMAVALSPLVTLALLAHAGLNIGVRGDRG